MRARQFSLATVMRIRNLEERLARERLFVAQRALRQAQGNYRSAHDALTSYPGPQDSTPIESVRWMHDQATRLGDALHESAKELLLAATHRDEVTASWHQARKRFEVLSRLDADGAARWRASVQREEAAELDDLTNARYARDRVRS